MKKIILVLVMLLFGAGFALAQTPDSFVDEIMAQAASGDAEAQCTLGYMYWLGNDVPQDDVKAFEWVAKAAQQGDITAQKALSGFYHLGTGINQDAQRAFEWMEQAALQGDPDAQVYVAQYYYEGRGVQRDVAKTMEWLNKAAAQGSEAAQAALAKLNGTKAAAAESQSGIMHPTAEAETLYSGALAYMHGNGVQQDLRMAFDLANQAAAQGSADACVLIGNMYMEGKVVTRNHKKALEWFLRAAESNHVQAQYLVSIMYFDGRGTTVNNTEALKWALIAMHNLPDNETLEFQVRNIRSRMTPSAKSKGEFLAEQWLKEYAAKE